jgi:hypothetical protein
LWCEHTRRAWSQRREVPCVIGMAHHVHLIEFVHYYVRIWLSRIRMRWNTSWIGYRHDLIFEGKCQRLCASLYSFCENRRHSGRQKGDDGHAVDAGVKVQAAALSTHQGGTRSKHLFWNHLKRSEPTCG